MYLNVGLDLVQSEVKTKTLYQRLYYMLTKKGLFVTLTLFFPQDILYKMKLDISDLSRQPNQLQPTWL